jgi:anti-sigma factor RsiW
MTCGELKKHLDAYLDGELEAGPMLEVESHLETCETCASLFLLKERMKSEVASLGASVKAPDRLRKRIEAISDDRTRRWWLAAAFAVPLAAAATLALVLVVGRGPAEGEPMSAVVDELVQRHSRELPMEVGGPDPTAASSWFRGKVDFPVTAPRLALKNASFQGARLSNVKSRQAAHMVYNVDGHRVTLMIFPAHRLSVGGGDVIRVDGKDVILGRRNGYNVAVMIDGDMAYALSSDLPSRRLVRMFTDPSI